MGISSVSLIGLVALHVCQAKTSSSFLQQGEPSIHSDLLNRHRARRDLFGSIAKQIDGSYPRQERTNERQGGSLRRSEQNLPSAESFHEQLDDSKEDHPNMPTNHDGPVAGSVPLYDPKSPWTSMAGYTPFSVEQHFGEDLSEAVFGSEALDRAKKFVEEGTWLYCGNEKNPYGFDVTLEDPVPGTAHFPGACGDNEEANAFINQGLTLRYAFNDNEAICSYRMAQQLAPDCALAYLFEALSAGPNVNYATIESPLAYKAILEAMTEAESLLEPLRGEADVEKVVDFYDALMLRYVPPGESLASMLAIEDDQERLDKYSETYASVSSGAYAGAMVAIHDKYPNDDDLATVAVGSLMQSPSWRWWQPGSEYQSEEPDSLKSAPILQTVKQMPNATKANTILKNILARDPEHLGANHYMIHNIEMGPNPEWALAVADRIWQADPRDGHITHMASHIYSRVGYYSKVLQMNKISNQVDFSWNKMRTGGGLMTTLYKYEPHNTEFNVVAGWNAGNFAESAAHVALLAQMSAFRMTANPSSGSLAYKLTYGMQIALKFGLWERIVEDTDENGSAPFGPKGQIPLMDGTEVGCIPCYDWVKFARTIALARQRRVDEAEAALNFYVYNVSGIPSESDSMSQDIDNFAKTVFSEASANVDTTSDQATGTLTINNGDRLVAVRALFAHAEVIRAQGNRTDATEAYRTAWGYQKILYYDEPTPFFVPIAETLGGFLVGENTQEATKEAADLFRQVLFVHPMAIRSVLGLEAALKQQDDFTGRNDASEIQFLVNHVLQYNDTAIDLNDML